MSQDTDGVAAGLGLAAIGASGLGPGLLFFGCLCSGVYFSSTGPTLEEWCDARRAENPGREIDCHFTNESEDCVGVFEGDVLIEETCREEERPPGEF